MPETTVLIAAAATVVAIILAFVALTMKKASPVFLNGKRQTIVLSKKIVISHDVIKFVFSLPTKEHKLGLPVGKHLQLFAPNKGGHGSSRALVAGQWSGQPDDEADHDEIERKYTPTSSDDDLGEVHLMLKVYKDKTVERFPDGGKMSMYLGQLEVGDKIDVQGPVGIIEYTGPGMFKYMKREIPCKHLGMIAGGTGITPMLQIAAQVLKNPSDKTTVSLLFANQTEEDILVRDELERLVEEHPTRFKLHYTLDRPPANWTGSSGFINPEMIQAHLPPPGEDTCILMCGPPPMIKFACRANLDKLEYPKNRQLAF